MEHLGDQACCRNEGMCACFDRLAVPAAFHLYTRMIVSGTLVPTALARFRRRAEELQDPDTRAGRGREGRNRVCGVVIIHVLQGGGARGTLCEDMIQLGTADGINRERCGTVKQKASIM